VIRISIGGREAFVSKLKAGVLIGIVWVVILSAAALLVYLGLDSYQKARVRLSDQATSYAHFIAQHDRFGFTVADVILRDMAEHLTLDDFNGTMSPERRRNVLAILKRHRERLPGIASFTLIGTDGIRRIGVVGKDLTDLSHRGYFQALRDGREFFISDVESGLASGKPGIHVARRFAAPDGGFGGVIVMNLAAEDVFFAYYKSMNIDKDFGTSLRDPQKILISFPQYTLNGSTLAAPDLVGEQIEAGRDKGLILAKDPGDGLEKITAFERLEGTNFFATASMPTAEPMSQATVLAASAVLAAFACIFGAAGATTAIRKTYALAKARDEAVQAGAERRMLIRKLNTVVEDERKNIAIEIHDVLNAMLIRMRLDAQGINSIATQFTPGSGETAEIAARAHAIITHAKDLYAQCRSIVTRLRPEILDVLGLEQALDEMVRNYNTAHRNCSFSFNSSGDLAAVETNVSIAAYRLIQEALSNVVKHANASVVTVSLKLDQSSGGRLDIVVADDGVGFDSAGASSGIGIVGMRERVAALNGQLNFRSCINTGTEISVSIPLALPT
jgi:signal transduction histidine kinase